MDYTQIKQICLTYLGDVTVKDLGFTAPGMHQFAITVGIKPNPTYLEIIPEDSAFYDKANPTKSFGTPDESDNRILNLNGTEDVNGVIAKLKKIKDTMPENRALPKEQTMTSIGKEPILSKEDKEIAEQIKETNKIAEGVPATEPAGLNDFMKEMLDTMEGISKRLESLEAKKKMGRPANKTAV